ncbi:hypothetical protein D3C84_626850 [compost metagenome]
MGPPSSLSIWVAVPRRASDMDEMAYSQSSSVLEKFSARARLSAITEWMRYRSHARGDPTNGRTSPSNSAKTALESYGLFWVAAASAPALAITKRSQQRYQPSPSTRCRSASRVCKFPIKACRRMVATQSRTGWVLCR